MHLSLRRNLAVAALTSGSFAFADGLAAQENSVASAVAAIRNGDLASAEQTLRKDLRTHPNDSLALDVLGAVLDQEKKFGDADEIYRRAVAASPRSPSLLNNYGNHLLARGKLQEAQAAFSKVLVLQPGHPNAGAQMARFALERKEWGKASQLLQRLPAEVQDRPDVLLLRMQAAYALHRNNEADELLKHATKGSEADAAQSFALGVALSAAGQHEKAESFFSRSLELQPDNFDALYDLGLAAAHAGHNERAQTVLAQALDKQEQNVDLLCDLAAVDVKLNRGETALELLVRARKLAPDRADIQLLLARTTSQLGYFADAVQAWQAYLSLRPDDEVARREQAFAQTAVAGATAGQTANAALAQLRTYAQRHPNDPMGQYEWGAAQTATDPEKALQSLTRAIFLKPEFAAAQLARGLLLYRENQPDLALKDFEKAAKEEPGNPLILGRLGQTYTALNRPVDAVRVLREAQRIAPEDIGVLLQLGRALSLSGKAEEAGTVFAHYRQLNANRPMETHPAGLVEFLNLSPDEQLARYREGVERTVAKNPDNADAQVRYLALLLADGNTAEALSVSDKINALQAGVNTIEKAADYLVEAGQYHAAHEMVKRAADRGVTSSPLQLDFAIATGAVQGANAGLELLDKIPVASRTGDVHLARAEFLEQTNRPDEAQKDLDAALADSPQRAALYRSAARDLLERDQATTAVRLLEKAAQVLPGDAALRLLRAFAHAMAGGDAEDEFKQIESRWPGWSSAWLAHGLVLEANGQSEKARIALATAASLQNDGSMAESSDLAVSFGIRPQNVHEKLLLSLPRLSF